MHVIGIGLAFPGIKSRSCSWATRVPATTIGAVPRKKTMYATELLTQLCNLIPVFPPVDTHQARTCIEYGQSFPGVFRCTGDRLSLGELAGADSPPATSILCPWEIKFKNKYSRGISERLAAAAFTPGILERDEIVDINTYTSPCPRPSKRFERNSEAT